MKYHYKMLLCIFSVPGVPKNFHVSQDPSDSTVMMLQWTSPGSKNGKLDHYTVSLLFSHTYNSI